MRRQGIFSLKVVFVSLLCLYQIEALSTSTCIVVCQIDVIKHMLQIQILSSRIGKWAYTLVEYDLACEPKSI